MATHEISSAGRQIVDALEALSETEVFCNRKRADRLGLSANDQKALRIVVDGFENGRAVHPSDIAHEVGLPSASVTVLLGRLENRGLTRRSVLSSDRFPTLIEPTADGTSVVSDSRLLGPELDGLLEELPAADADCIARFLTGWSSALRAREAAAA